MLCLNSLKQEEQGRPKLLAFLCIKDCHPHIAALKLPCNVLCMLLLFAGDPIGKCFEVKPTTPHELQLLSLRMMLRYTGPITSHQLISGEWVQELQGPQPQPLQSGLVKQSQQQQQQAAGQLRAGASSAAAVYKGPGGYGLAAAGGLSRGVVTRASAPARPAPSSPAPYSPSLGPKGAQVQGDLHPGGAAAAAAARRSAPCALGVAALYPGQGSGAYEAGPQWDGGSVDGRQHGASGAQEGSELEPRGTCPTGPYGSPAPRAAAHGSGGGDWRQQQQHQQQQQQEEEGEGQVEVYGRVDGCGGAADPREWVELGQELLLVPPSPDLAAGSPSSRRQRADIASSAAATTGPPARQSAGGYGVGGGGGGNGEAAYREAGAAAATTPAAAAMRRSSSPGSYSWRDPAATEAAAAGTAALDAKRPRSSPGGLSGAGQTMAGGSSSRDGGGHKGHWSERADQNLRGSLEGVSAALAGAAASLGQATAVAHAVAAVEQEIYQKQQQQQEDRGGVQQQQEQCQQQQQQRQEGGLHQPQYQQQQQQQSTSGGDDDDQTDAGSESAPRLGSPVKSYRGKGDVAGGADAAGNTGDVIGRWGVVPHLLRPASPAVQAEVAMSNLSLLHHLSHGSLQEALHRVGSPKAQPASAAAATTVAAADGGGVPVVASFGLASQSRQFAVAVGSGKTYGSPWDVEKRGHVEETGRGLLQGGNGGSDQGSEVGSWALGTHPGDGGVTWELWQHGEAGVNMSNRNSSQHPPATAAAARGTGSVRADSGYPEQGRDLQHHQQQSLSLSLQQQQQQLVQHGAWAPSPTHRMHGSPFGGGLQDALRDSIEQGLQSAAQAEAAVGAAEGAVLASNPGSPGQRRFAIESNIIRQSAAAGGIGGCFSPRRTGPRSSGHTLFPQQQQQFPAGPFCSSGQSYHHQLQQQGAMQVAGESPVAIGSYNEQQGYMQGSYGSAGGVIYGVDRGDTNLLRDSLSRSHGNLAGIAAVLGAAADELRLENAPSSQIMQQQLSCYFQQQQHQEQQQQVVSFEMAQGLGKEYLMQQQQQFQLQGLGQGSRRSSSWQAGGLTGRGGCSSVSASYSSLPGGLVSHGPAMELQAEVLKLKQEVRWLVLP